MSIFKKTHTKDSSNILSMSTLTDLQRNKRNILPWENITYDPSILQWNYPSLYYIKPEEDEKGTKVQLHTLMHARTQTHSVRIISTFVTTFLLSLSIYLRFPDFMFRFELWGRVVRTCQTATKLDRPWMTLADLGLSSRNKPSRYEHTPSCVKVCYVMSRFVAFSPFYYGTFK